MLIIKPGTRVRMSEHLKQALIKNGSKEHVREFNNCIGVVQGLTDYNNCKPGDPKYDQDKVGPEVDVRWQPSNLRYAYAIEKLVIIK